MLGAGIAIIQFTHRACETDGVFAEIFGAEIMVIANDRVMQALAVQAIIYGTWIAVIQRATWGEDTYAVCAGIPGAGIIIIANDRIVETSAAEAVVIGTCIRISSAARREGADTVRTAIDRTRIGVRANHRQVLTGSVHTGVRSAQVVIIQDTGRSVYTNSV